MHIWGVALSAWLVAVSPPEIVHQVDATYPPEELEQGHEGTVVLQVTVAVDGSVRDVNVVASVSPLLDGAAIAAVMQWRFEPARREGEAVPSRIDIPIVFERPKAEGPQTAQPPTEQSPTAQPAAGQPQTAQPQTGQPQTAQPKPEAPSADRRDPGSVLRDPKTDAQEGVLDVTVRGKQKPASRGASDYQFEIGALKAIPRTNAAEILKLAPGILLTNEGGEGHAEQVFLRGFDAREGQDIEFSVDGVPINESGNLHGNGYSDTHFIIPELVESLRVIEGPFDPRQGNYAVAGSAEYHLGLAQRGLTAKVTEGSFQTTRALFTFGSPNKSEGNFFAADIYKTTGFGANRNGQRGTIMAQVEGALSGSTIYRLTAQAYTASFHTAGVIRDDDFRAGRIKFYGTYDPLQGEDSARYSVAGMVETREDEFTIRNQFFLIYRPLRIRENFTGFLLDVQEPLQQPHPQRGDLLDLHNTAFTFGAKGMVRAHREIFGLPQELEVGYYGRGDVVSSIQQRIEAATGHPYHTDTDLDSILGDVGMYADANIKAQKWLTLRGGARADLFTYDVNDKCAVQSVAKPSASNPPGDSSCLSQENFGAYRDPNQRASTFSTAAMPRASLLIGPFYGVSVTASTGRGVRSIDPIYITQDIKTPFAKIVAYESGLTYEHRVGSSANLSASSVIFETSVDRDLIFSQTVGRAVLSPGTHRIGNASTVRFSGWFWDLAANSTVVKATYDDTHNLIPYVPDLVLRFDGSLKGTFDQLSIDGEPMHASASSGVSYVGRRPLPFGERADTIFTIDGSLIAGWRWIDLMLSVQNLLDRQYRLGEYNYASDFHSQAQPTLVPTRHFAAGAPRTVMFSVILNYGGFR